jgi:hypothetical protein
MITLDDLTKDYRDEIAKPQYPGWDEKHRAGVRRVVERLRDEIFDARGNASYGSLAIYDLFNEILGDAGEKVAGGTSREAAPEGVTLTCSTPATDAAPAVCEWTKGFETYENRKWWRAACGHSFYGTPTFENCKCGKPIKFTEAK